MLKYDNKSLLINLAIKAGNEIMIYFKKNPETNYKSDNSPVTEADIAANAIIVGELQKLGIPVISEESVNLKYTERKNLKKFWLVDPLDGTKQFVNGENEFTVNIALIVDNEAVEGVVYAPALNLLYYGNAQNGAVRIDFSSDVNDELKIPAFKTTKHTIVASKSHLNKETMLYLTHLLKIFPDANTVNIGSSLKFCMIAEGKADIYPRLGQISEWDIAAGHAVVKAAGGNVVDLKTGKELVYNSETLKTPDFVAVYDNSLITASRLIDRK